LVSALTTGEIGAIGAITTASATVMAARRLLSPLVSRHQRLSDSGEENDF
jgi:hypothetical protein